MIIKPKAEERWENILQEEIDWKSVWLFNLQAVKESKLTEFNYKLLHNLIPHRYNLYKWKLRDNPLCSFDGEIQDNVHLFVTCKKTQLFWVEFASIVYQLVNIKLDFGVATLIKGYELKNKKYRILNLLIMYARYAIYSIFIRTESRSCVFHELGILCLFKRLICNRLEMEKRCKRKNLCIFENSIVEEKISCFV